MKANLSGKRCLCRSCDKLFNSEHAFNKHRVGKQGKDRRCLSIAEMENIGMAVNYKGLWVSEPLDYKPDDKIHEEGF